MLFFILITSPRMDAYKCWVRPESKVENHFWIVTLWREFDEEVTKLKLKTELWTALFK